VAAVPLPVFPTPSPQPLWGKVIDHARCIGCHACTTACKSEHEVPLSVTRTYVKYVDVGAFPLARRAFQVTRCNQCDDAPCVAACPTAAMYRRPDGIVDFDKAACIGCKACIAACPYDAIFVNPSDHSAEKCNFCAHRLDAGLEPACVVVCPTEAILVGDLNDPRSRVARTVLREPVTVRRPEKGTRPKLFYRGASGHTLDPLAARNPGGGLFLWAEQPAGSHVVPGGHPGAPNSSAAAVLAYDVAHRAPWDWRVSLYTWTKGIAAGGYLVPLLLTLLGAASATGALWTWAAPVLAGAFLALTGLILILDLEHPERFYFLFTRPQARSWLVKGGFIIAGYALVLALHFGAGLLGRPGWREALRYAGAPLGALTAVYTAYLFAQAKARDLWQNPLLPPHLLAQALLAGAAALLPLATWLEPAAAGATAWLLAAAALAHVLFVLGEITLPHPTAHARLAARAMTHGAYARFLWPGLVLAAAGLLAPWLGAPAAAAALLGLLAHEHAYVQAGQSVPLA
jgi:Fe-S-cluster-containing dehydrogenase component/formate-dependent nitrite reductase membrane component NrfD